MTSRWAPRLRWISTTKAEHDGQVYVLWRQPGRPDGPRGTWALHRVLPNGDRHHKRPTGRLGYLSGNLREARRVAELLLVDRWEPIHGRRAPGGDELWRSPRGGDERPLAELLRGEHRTTTTPKREGGRRRGSRRHPTLIAPAAEFTTETREAPTP